MIKKFIILCLMSSLSSTLLAETSTSRSDFIQLSKIGTSAKTIRTGNIEGFSSHSNSVFENPAGLYRVKHISANAFKTTFMNEVDFMSFSGGIRFKSGVLAAGYMTAGVKDIPKTYKILYDDYQYDYGILEYFDYLTNVYKASIQFSQTEQIHWGLSVSYYDANLEQYYAKGLNLDAGIIVDVEPLELSISLQRIISALKVKWQNRSDPSYSGYEILPFQACIGAKYTLWDFQLLGQFRSLKNRIFMKHFGLNFRPFFIPIIEFSGGYKEFEVINEVKSSITFGMGLNLLGIGIDYAYEKSEHIEYSHKHYVSLGFNF